MRSLALTLIALASLLASSTGQAQGGDDLAAASTPLSFVRVESGITGEVKDDCLYLKLEGDPGLVAVGDLRITKCQTRKVGTLVAAGDAEVAAGQSAVAVALTVSYVDLDSTGAFSPGDAVYADTDPAPGFAPATSQASFTLRLTAQPGLTAGTIVREYESDANTVSVNLPASSFGFVDGASGSPGALDASDAWFLLAGTAPGATGAVPPASVRLRNDGPFGSLTPAASPPSSSSTETASETSSSTPTGESESSSSTPPSQTETSTSAAPDPVESSTQTSAEPPSDGNATTAAATDATSPADGGSPSPLVLGKSSTQARGSGFGPLFALAAVGAALLLARRRL